MGCLGFRIKRGKMKFNTREIGRLKIIDVEREFTAQVGENFREYVDSLLKSGVIFIAVNLDKIDYINSLALGIILSKMRACRDRGGDLFIVNAIEKIKNIFRLTKLDQIIKIYDSEGDVVKKISMIENQ